MLAAATATGECGQAGLSVAATIAWVSEGERAKPRRRRGGRRGRRAASPTDQVTGPGADGESRAETVPTPITENNSANGLSAAVGGTGRPRRRQGARLRTVHEISAGGLVIDGIDGPREDQLAALIGRMDRRGRMIWSLPKGHIEQGETAEQTAIREVAEETGIHGHVLAALGSIDYWFVTEGRRVHKTVHHYLLRFSGGELCDEDVEVTEVAWVPVTELPKRLAYADERRLAKVAHDLIALLQSDGPAALPPLPPTTPALRKQTHSRTRAHHFPDEGSDDPRTNGCGSGA
jgi:8-oxo-dGTP pyrophosphatase MutT (NUDIX family)